MIVRASDSVHSQAVDSETTVAYADKALVEQGKGEAVKQPDHIEVVDRAEAVHAKGGEVQRQAILDVLRAAFPNLNIEVVERATAEDNLVIKSHRRILIA